MFLIEVLAKLVHTDTATKEGLAAILRENGFTSDEQIEAHLNTILIKAKSAAKCEELHEIAREAPKQWLPTQ